MDIVRCESRNDCSHKFAGRVNNRASQCGKRVYLDRLSNKEQDLWNTKLNVLENLSALCRDIYLYSSLIP
jgi:hypothetical protein